MWRDLHSRKFSFSTEGWVTPVAQGCHRSRWKSKPSESCSDSAELDWDDQTVNLKW